MTNFKPYCINLWAGPGVGKSRTRAMLFNLMKYRGYTVEEVTEFAKEMTYIGGSLHPALHDPFFMFGTQEFRQFLLRDHVEWIVTDSPPGLTLAYCREEDYAPLLHVVRHARRRYINFDVVLTRDPERPYQEFGRNQTETEAKEIDTRVTRVLGAIFIGSDIRAIHLRADEEAPEEILRFIHSVPMPRSA